MKNSNMIKLAVSAATLCLMTSTVNADDEKPKITIKNNMILVTHVKPKSVDNISDMFKEGILYGRLRMNSFKWDSDIDTNDNHAFGLGGSLRYKTASFKGVSAKAGLYYGDSPFESLRMSQEATMAAKVRSGKDMFSRSNVRDDGVYSMAVLAELNLQYKYSKTTLIAGRQIFESFLTRSNDTKMIPNTFEGAVVEMKELPNTRIRAAYFGAQKLRDHTEFHDVVTFRNASGDAWNNNDDSGVHRGISHANLTAAGQDTENALILVDFKNTSIKGLKVDVTYAAVPNLFSSLTGELNYKIPLGGGYSLNPGARYMHQMDNGAGVIAGASLRGTLAGQTGSNLGYENVDSVNASLGMARLVLKKGALKALIAYSAVAGSGADIIAPWRGFPTGGYTRGMAQVNWQAGTKTIGTELHYDFGKDGLIPGFSALLRYDMQDFDEAKQAAGVQADSNIVHIDLRENITTNIWTRFRMAFVDADTRVLGSRAGRNVDSYNEFRFEVNYLF